MAESEIRKEIRFPDIQEDIFRLLMIGYNNFRHIVGWEFFRVHSWVSLHYVISGRGKLFIRGRKYDIQAGEFFLIPSDEPIMYYPDKNDPWEYYWINFHANSKFDISERIGLNAYNPVRAAQMPHEVDQIFKELFSTTDVTTQLYYKTLAVVMNILSTESQTTLNTTSEIHSKENLIAEAKQIIHLNSSRADFSVSALPNMLFLSQRYLGKLFKELTGMTPVAYLSEVRLNHAAELLHKRDYTISELCREVGFGDELYFMKRFKKKFSLTVKEYRKYIKQANYTKE